MKQVLTIGAIAIAACALTTNCQKNKPTLKPFIIQPGIAFGRITPTSSALQLSELYGKNNIITENTYAAEKGKPQKRTILFPKDPKKELTILWKDEARLQYPKSISILGYQSTWRTEEGITLGTTLKEIEMINQSPFRVFCYAHPQRGGIASWNNGKLQQEYQSTFSLIFDLSHPPDKLLHVETEVLIDASDLPSDHEILQKLNPTVISISCKNFDPTLSFPKPTPHTDTK